MFMRRFVIPITSSTTGYWEILLEAYMISSQSLDLQYTLSIVHMVLFCFVSI